MLMVPAAGGDISAGSCTAEQPVRREGGVQGAAAAECARAQDGVPAGRAAACAGRSWGPTPHAHPQNRQQAQLVFQQQPESMTNIYTRANELEHELNYHIRSAGRNIARQSGAAQPTFRYGGDVRGDASMVPPAAPQDARQTQHSSCVRQQRPPMHPSRLGSGCSTLSASMAG